MNVLLINPPRFKGIPVIREDRCEIVERNSILPPYSLAQLASVLRINNHDVTLIDANCLNISVNHLKEEVNRGKFDICIFRFTPITLREDMVIAKICKESHSIRTVGICWTLRNFSHEVLKNTKDLDIYIIDEPLIVIPQLIDKFNNHEPLENAKGIAFRENGRIISTNRSMDDFNYDDMPLPAFDLLPPLEKYYVKSKHVSPYSIIQTSKGCPFRCIYCTMAKTKWNPRSSAKIFQELEYLKNEHKVNTISFFDETFTLDRKRVVDICNKILENKLKINWHCNTRTNTVDLELLKLMKEAGCRGISFGIESGNQQLLDFIKKGTTVDQNEKAISYAKSAGIKTYCSFVFGFPGEDGQTVKDTLSFVKRTLPNGAQFNMAVPYPGTELFELAIRNEWIPKEIDWNNLFQHRSIMHTENLTIGELDHIRKIAYRSLYLNPKWVIMNLRWLFHEPNDLPIAIDYYLNSLINFFIYNMKHAH